MDVETWRKSEKVIKKSQKHYAHFDYRTSLADQWEYISDPENVAKHGFYPFIHYTQKSDKFNPATKKKKPKSREIRYAAHIDSCIYQYYSNRNIYEKYSERGAHGKHGNFLTYIERADGIFRDEKYITRDTKRHMQKIRSAITPQ